MTRPRTKLKRRIYSWSWQVEPSPDGRWTLVSWSGYLNCPGTSGLIYSFAEE